MDESLVIAYASPRCQPRGQVQLGEANVGQLCVALFAAPGGSAVPPGSPRSSLLLGLPPQG